MKVHLLLSVFVSKFSSSKADIRLGLMNWEQIA